MKARIWLLQGSLVRAQEWVREQKLSPDDALSYLREYEILTLARVFIAQYQNDRSDDALPAAEQLLDRLLKAAEEGNRNGSVNHQCSMRMTRLLLRLGELHDVRDGGREATPVFAFGLQLLAAQAGERVELRPPVVFGLLPLGGDAVLVLRRVGEVHLPEHRRHVGRQARLQHGLGRLGTWHRVHLGA